MGVQYISTLKKKTTSTSQEHVGKNNKKKIDKSVTTELSRYVNIGPRNYDIHKNETIVVPRNHDAHKNEIYLVPGNPDVHKNKMNFRKVSYYNIMRGNK